MHLLYSIYRIIEIPITMNFFVIGKADKMMNYNGDNSKIFGLNIDKIKYKHENQITEISYNQTLDKAGLLDTTKEPSIITFPELSKVKFIKHGFSTRLGGVSEDYLNSMNLSFSRGDREENVIENFKRICNCIEIQVEDLVFSDQVHDTKIHVATNVDRGKGIVKEKELVGMDGLITNVANLPLVTFYADCVPLYFVDTKKKAIGLSHSGWKGTVNKMGLKTVEAMKKAFSSTPKDIIVVIGPSICRDCYEVSEDVAIEFKNSFSKEQVDAFLEEKPNQKYQLDLWLANKYILLEAGIPEENITISDICTCCNSTLLYSHRATGGKRGNLAAFLSLSI